MNLDRYEMAASDESGHQEQPAAVSNAVKEWDEIAAEEFEVSSDLSPMDYIFSSLGDGH